MSEDVVLLDVGDGIATVTLNRPQAMNALNRTMRQRLAEVMRAIDAEPVVRAVILTGAGERAFTAGLDLKELGSEAGALGSANTIDPADNPVKAIELCGKSVIGAINGVAITGGFEVALACDLLPLARKLASDMAGIDPAFRAGYKRLIDDGYAISFGEGMALEAARSSAANRTVAPEEVEARRAAVQARGRGQG